MYVREAGILIRESRDPPGGFDKLMVSRALRLMDTG